jgi:hypothetical protein
MKKQNKSKAKTRNDISRREFLKKSGKTALVIGGLIVSGGTLITPQYGCKKDDPAPTSPNQY